MIDNGDDFEVKYALGRMEDFYRDMADIGDRYYGMSHLHLPGWMVRLWKRFMCGRGYHLFDEVATVVTEDEKQNGFMDHYLSCDACELSVEISRIDDQYVDEEVKARFKKKYSK